MKGNTTFSVSNLFIFLFLLSSTATFAGGVTAPSGLAGKSIETTFTQGTGVFLHATGKTFDEDFINNNELKTHEKGSSKNTTAEYHYIKKSNQEGVLIVWNNKGKYEGVDKTKLNFSNDTFTMTSNFLRSKAKGTFDFISSTN